MALVDAMMARIASSSSTCARARDVSDVLARLAFFLHHGLVSLATRVRDIARASPSSPFGVARRTSIKTPGPFNRGIARLFRLRLRVRRASAPPAPPRPRPLQRSGTIEREKWTIRDTPLRFARERVLRTRLSYRGRINLPA